MKRENRARPLVTAVAVAVMAAAAAGAGQTAVGGGGPAADGGSAAGGLYSGNVAIVSGSDAVLTLTHRPIPPEYRTLLLTAYARERARIAAREQEVAAEVAAGFDWGDAGIGAGVAAALALLAGGAVARRKHESRSAILSPKEQTGQGRSNDRGSGLFRTLG